MRLTAELVNGALSYLNPLKERELDLRGNNIQTIENLGVARDHESIDFTDNDIQMLSGFPLTPRLQTLLVARNRISNIQPSLGRSLPNLRTLVLSSNRIEELADLDVLEGFTKLTHASFIENPVAGKENYRYYVLWRCPSIRFLDFQKVKDAERERARELFGTSEAPTALAQRVMAARSKWAAGATSVAIVNGASKSTKLKLSDNERKRLENLIKKAKTLAEVQRYEKALAEGRLPPGLADEDAMDET